MADSKVNTQQEEKVVAISSFVKPVKEMKAGSTNTIKLPNGSQIVTKY